jgi:phage portal protein BeeE
MSLSLIQDTLAPYLTKIEQEMRRKLLPPTGRVQSAYTFQFDINERLRSDLKTMLDAIAVGRQWGVYTVDEARQRIGLNPVGGKVGSMLLSPVNMLNAEIAVDWTPQSKSAPLDSQTSPHRRTRNT